MSTPVLIDPINGNVVLNVKSGPAVGFYKSSTLDGDDGALTQFKKTLESITGNAAKTAANDKLLNIAKKYRNSKNLQARLTGNLATAKMRKNETAIRNITARLEAARANKRSAKGSEFNNVLKQQKIACGWTKGWLPGSLVAPKNPKQGCASTDFVSGGTRRRKRT